MLSEQLMELIPESMRCWFDHEYCLSAVTQDGTNIRYVQDQNREVCIAALNTSGMILELIHNQTYEICALALSHSMYQIDCVQFNQLSIEEQELLLANYKSQTGRNYSSQWYDYSYCWDRVKYGIYNIKYVQDQTHELCMYVVGINGYALQSIHKHTYEICSLAIKTTPSAIHFVQFNQLTEDEASKILREYQVMCMRGLVSEVLQ